MQTFSRGSFPWAQSVFLEGKLKSLKKNSSGLFFFPFSFPFFLLLDYKIEKKLWN